MDKKCYTCKTMKTIADFNKNKAKKDGLNTICKECSRERSRRYYRENPNSHKLNVFTRNRKIKKENAEKLYNFLNDKSCIDCGYAKNRIALQFDHVRGVKKDSVSKLVCQGYSWDTILEEINKCEIRCANCHMIKTADQLDWYVAKL